MLIMFDPISRLSFILTPLLCTLLFFLVSSGIQAQATSTLAPGEGKFLCRIYLSVKIPSDFILVYVCIKTQLDRMWNLGYILIIPKRTSISNKIRIETPQIFTQNSQHLKTMQICCCFYIHKYFMLSCSECSSWNS